MNKPMRVWLAIFSIAGLSNQAHADALENERQSVIQNPRHNFHFTPEETRRLYKTPIGSHVILSLENGKVEDAVYLGQVIHNGQPTVLFAEGREMPKSDIARLKAQGASEISESGHSQDSIPTEGSKQNPQNSNAPKGQASGSWGEGALRDAGEAGAEAGIMKGFIRGVIDTPGNRRATEQALREYEEAYQRTQADRLAAQKEFFQYEKGIRKELAEISKEFAEYKPLAARIAPPENQGFSQSAPGKIVAGVRSRMIGFESGSKEGDGLRDMSLGAASASENEFGQGNSQNSGALAKLALSFADIAMGLFPPTSIAQNAYALFTGENLVTGERLSNGELTLAGAILVADLATAGLAGSVVQGIELSGHWLIASGKYAPEIFAGIGEFGAYAKKLGVTTASAWKDLAEFSRRTLGSQIGAVGNISKIIEKSHLGKWAEKFEIQSLKKADVMNARYLAKNPTHLPPYRASTDVIDGILKSDEKFVRLHGASNAERSWVVRAESIPKNTSAADLRVKLSLPFTPEFISEVKVPRGTMMRRSKVATAFGGGENAVQYEILDPISNGTKFSPALPLEDFLGR